MNRRRTLAVAALAAAAVTGAVVAIALRGGAPAPAGSAPPPVATATVVRTNLATNVLTEGTLGYAASAPVVNHTAGTYTSLPAPGTVINPGQPLYRVDNTPVVLMVGATPAWRPFQAGMADGLDVAELQSNLISLGYASGLVSTPDGHFGAATVGAVERWQHAAGMAVNGVIPFGGVVFLPEAVLVGASNVALGQPAAPGDTPYAATTTVRVVSVPLNPNLPDISVGEAVSIILPTNTSMPGKITAIVAVGASGGSGSSSSSGSGSGSGGGSGGDSSGATSMALVKPDDTAATGSASGEPVQVSLTTESVTNVLALPIAALLALSGGGYGVEVVSPPGTHHLVGVTTGLFTGSQVQVSGSGIEAGTTVVVAQ
jgi:peptidoglycan hydrolase-like protein with peptidoglycan-binding domain